MNSSVHSLSISSRSISSFFSLIWSQNFEFSISLSLALTYFWSSRIFLYPIFYMSNSWIWSLIEGYSSFWASKTMLRMPFKCSLGKEWIFAASSSFYSVGMFWASSKSLGSCFFFFFASLNANYACCCCCCNNFLSFSFSFYISFSFIFSSFSLSFYSLSLSLYFSFSSFLSLTGFASAPAILKKYLSKSAVILINSSFIWLKS